MLQRDWLKKTRSIHFLKTENLDVISASGAAKIQFKVYYYEYYLLLALFNK